MPSLIFYFIIAVVTILMAALVRPFPAQRAVAQRAVAQRAVAQRAVAQRTIVRAVPLSRRQMFNMAALLFIVTLLFLVSAMRLNVGNDYLRYVEIMYLINIGADVNTEPGFNALVNLVYGLSGFQNYLAVFAIIAMATIVMFLWTIYRDSEDFCFTFFFFMCFGYYFQSLSSVRYYLAMAIIAFAIPFVWQRKWVHFILSVLAAAAFQKNALIVILLYPLAIIKWRKWMLAAAGVLCATLFFFQDFYVEALLYFYPNYRPRIDFFLGNTEVSYINIIRCGGILALALLYYRQAIAGNERNRFYFMCNLGALVIYVTCSFVPFISRIAYYLTITHMFFLPGIIRRIEDKRQRRFFTIAVLVAGVLYLIIYLIKAQADGVRLMPYQTFIFHELPPIRSLYG